MPKVTALLDAIYLGISKMRQGKYAESRSLPGGHHTRYQAKIKSAREAVTVAAIGTTTHFPMEQCLVEAEAAT